MLCPYCKKEMETGSIKSKYPIEWEPSTKRGFVASLRAWPESVTLGDVGFFRPSAVTAYNCRNCKKVLIDYSKPDPIFD